MTAYRTPSPASPCSSRSPARRWRPAGACRRRPRTLEPSSTPRSPSGERSPARGSTAARPAATARSYVDGLATTCDPELKPPLPTTSPAGIVRAPRPTAEARRYVFDHWNGCNDASGTSCDAARARRQDGRPPVFRDNEAPGVTLTEPATDSGAARDGRPRRLGDRQHERRGVSSFASRGALIGSRDTTAPLRDERRHAPRPADGSAAVTATAFDAAGNSVRGVAGRSRSTTPSPASRSSGPDAATVGPSSTQSWTINATRPHHRTAQPSSAA